jgi:C4-dicarboxylate-specific signal transduction histidine kinase
VKISALCHDDASAKGVQLGVESAYASAPLIASRIGIEQVLNNLVANAIDAASERADRSGSVVMRLESAGDRVAIMIEDNGRGVAPEIADTLFEAYRSTKPRGMGLGLAISRQIVQRHAGRIWWEPIAPTGTRFVIELPFGGVASRQVAPR